ncbi:MAG: methylated-DNA--[protein]-cysteine S-methyltransferase [Planctomycetes bacterium]|nr:methylated-DNA--[protein]-cysteine S-methyltransferase [Planctomycetota bacterium]
MIGTPQKSERTARKGDDAAAHDQQTIVYAFDSELGWMAIAWRDGALQGIAFGHASRRNAEMALARSLRLSQSFSHIVGDRESHDLPPWVDQLIDKLRRFADGEAVDFSDVPLDLDHLTPFARRVVAACRRIDWGRVRTYGDLASECQAPGAARAVGTVMSKNRHPLVVPCHRVLAAGGALGGYSAPDGLRMKRRLLAMEGSLNDRSIYVTQGLQ